MFEDILGKDKEYLTDAEKNQKKIEELWKCEMEDEYNDSLMEQTSHE